LVSANHSHHELACTSSGCKSESTHPATGTRRLVSTFCQQRWPYGWWTGDGLPCSSHV